MFAIKSSDNAYNVEIGVMEHDTKENWFAYINKQHLWRGPGVAGARKLHTRLSLGRFTYVCVYVCVRVCVRPRWCIIVHNASSID